MRILLCILLLNMGLVLFSANITSVYLFPGQGSDERIFSKLKLDSNFHFVYISYPIPEKDVTLADYARTISKQIDTTEKYIFIGVSMGGMICCELADYLKPDKIIIISSAKCYQELPFRYRFMRAIPLYKFLPKGMIKIGAQMMQPIVEPDRKKDKEIFKSMLKMKSPTYYKRTVKMIINWRRTDCNNKVYHIHGTNDHTIPIRNLSPNYKIEKGSHMMALTRGDELNNLILSILVNQ